jgi:hypothetical protein
MMGCNGTRSCLGAFDPLYVLLGKIVRELDTNPTEKFHRKFSMEIGHMELHRVSMKLHRNSP